MAKITHYDIGDEWTPQATFTVGGVGTNPTTLTVKAQAPDGTETVLANAVDPATLGPSTTPVAKTATGVFKAYISLTTAGYHYVKFTGTGAATTSETHEAIVDPDAFTSEFGISSRALVGLGEVKDWLQGQNVDTANDLELVRVINDISDRFHAEAEREFKVVGTNPQVRTFAVEPVGRSRPQYIDGDYVGDLDRTRRTVRIGDLTSLTGVTITGTDWTTVLETVALGNVTGHPLVRQAWEPIRELEFQTNVTALGYGMRLNVTGNWGFPAVPGNVRQAVLDGIAWAMDRDVEHYRQDLAATGSGGGVGGATYVTIGGGRQRLLSLPPTSLAVAWSYRDNHIG